MNLRQADYHNHKSGHTRVFAATCGLATTCGKIANRILAPNAKYNCGAVVPNENP